MRTISKVASLAIVGASAVASAPSVHGAFEVFDINPGFDILGLVMLLTSVTALTFIVVLLACGMRDPVL